MSGRLSSYHARKVALQNYQDEGDAITASLKVEPVLKWEKAWALIQREGGATLDEIAVGSGTKRGQVSTLIAFLREKTGRDIICTRKGRESCYVALGSSSS